MYTFNHTYIAYTDLHPLVWGKVKLLDKHVKEANVA